MRKVILYIATSIDGKIAGADHSLDWLPQPGEDDENDYGYEEMYHSIDTVLMGHKTYEICNSFGEWPYKGKTAYIFTRNKDKKTIEQATLVNDDPAAFTKQLKSSAGKDIWLIGGGQINTLLHDAGLIDEYIITVIPHILGAGIELFPDIQREQKMELYKHRVYNNGLAMLYYRKNR